MYRMAFAAGRSPAHSSPPETSTVSLMLRLGHRELLKHPVTESFLYLKWQQCRKFYLTGLIYSLMVAITVSCSVNSSGSAHVSKWVLLAFHVPITFKLTLDALCDPSSFFFCTWRRQFWWRPPGTEGQNQDGPPRTVSLPLPSLPNVLRVVSAALCVAHALVSIASRSSNKHLDSWALLFTWMVVTIKTHRWPGFVGVLTHALALSAWDMTKFIFSAGLPLLLGFYLSLRHLSPRISSERFAAMIFGNVANAKPKSANDDLSGEVSAELLLAAFLIVMVAAGVNVLVGLAVYRVKEAVGNAEDFILARMVTNASEIEATWIFADSLLSCCFKINLALSKKFTQLLPDEDRCVFRLLPYRDRCLASGDEPLLLGWGSTSTSPRSQPVFRATHDVDEEKVNKKVEPLFLFTVPDWIWPNARPIVEELHELLRDRREGLKGAHRQPGDYTSLYWTPGEQVCLPGATPKVCHSATHVAHEYSPCRK